MKKYKMNNDFLISSERRIENSLNLDVCTESEVYPSESASIIADPRVQLRSYSSLLLDIYLPEIIANSEKIELADADIRRYKFKPKTVSMDFFSGIPDYWFLILAVNNYKSIYEFKGFDSLYIPSRNNVETIMNGLEK